MRITLKNMRAGMTLSIADIRRLNEESGGTFFDRSHVRHSASMVYPTVIRHSYGWLFVTSERRREYDEENQPLGPRRYTVRMMLADGAIVTVNERGETDHRAYMQHTSKRAAIRAAQVCAARAKLELDEEIASYV